MNGRADDHQVTVAGYSRCATERAKEEEFATDYNAHDPQIVKNCELCVLEDHRIFYICHTTRSCHWEPPWASWRCRQGLPYGWEMAVDQMGTYYYIDHVNRTTTYDDPRQSSAPLGRRSVRIDRKEGMGYGFVAAGQHPTIIQFVSPDGPSDGILFPNDQIISVEGVDVSSFTKDEVVERVRSSIDCVEMEVEQLPPRTSRSARRHFKVRFTDRVVVAARPDSPTDFPPPLPNVLRIFLENGQTRSFKYESDTTVKDVLLKLLGKLQITCTSFFSLAVEYSLGARTSRVSLLRQDTLVANLISLPNSSHLRCVLRFSFVPKDVHSILAKDDHAFEYFYQQCVNDVIRGRFAFEMRYEACVRLAALQMQQVSVDSTILKEGTRVSLSRIEKEYGLDTFLPTILLENVKRREIRKHIRFYLKKDSSNLAECLNPKDDDQKPPKCSTTDIGLMVRLKYVHVVSNLTSFGGRGFAVTFKESHIDMIMQIEPRNGLLVRHPGKSGQPAISIGFDLIGKLVVRAESEAATLVSIRLASNPNQGLEFLVERDDVDDLVAYLAGYYKVHLSRDLPCDFDVTPPTPVAPPTSPPTYASTHNVISAGWNYTPECSSNQKVVDLTSSPPDYSIANSFTQLVIQNADGAKNISNGKSPMRGAGISGLKKPLLKATDSLLLKSSRQLQASPLLKRASNPTGRKDTVSDSSDTEDSSWSSPLRSPLNSARSTGMDTLLESCELLPPPLSGRRESIETLMQANPAQNTNLESLILKFPGSSESAATTPSYGGTDAKFANGHGIASANGGAKGRTVHRASLTYSEATTSSPLDEVEMIDGEATEQL